MNNRQRQELKNQAIALYKSGESVPQIAKQVGFGISTVYNWVSTVHTTEDMKHRKTTDPELIKELVARVHSGEPLKRVSEDLNVNYQTAYAWTKKHKTDIKTSYTTSFKRNVIGSLQAGRSTYEVMKTFNITQAELNKWIEEFKDGKYDVTVNVTPQVKNALVDIAPVEKPAIQTMSIAALDNVLDVVKMLTSKGMSIDDAIDTSKSLMHKLK